MSVPERYLVLAAEDPTGDVGWALFPLGSATLARLRGALAVLERARREQPDLSVLEVSGHFADVHFVAHTRAMSAYVGDFESEELHEALVDHLSAAEEPTVSDHHLLPELLAPVAQAVVAIGPSGDITVRTYWGESDDILASTDLHDLEREASSH